MKNKILVTGVNGQLGHDVVAELKKRNIETVGADISDFDITDRNATEEFILKENPSGIIHCAAYTAVDKAEEEKDLCEKINLDGTKNLLDAAQKIGAKFIFISTDYVFGADGENFLETDDEREPLNEYGRTKLEAEKAVEKYEKSFIVRTSWVFGINGGNFVKTMLRLSETKDELNVVSDQIGSPTYTVDLARLLVDMILSDKYGVYHATNENVCSWAEFAEKIMRLANAETKINYIKTAEYKTAARRPLNSRLSKACLDKNGFERLPVWENALERYIKELSK